MAEKNETFDADFFKWLREKQLKENEKNQGNDKFEPLYITIEQPPSKKKTTPSDDENDLPPVNNDTRVNFEIETDNTDNCVVYKL